MKSVEEAVQKVGDAVAANADKVDGIIATGYTPSVAIARS
jgi:ribose transport system substrate-binding protein